MLVSTVRIVAGKKTYALSKVEAVDLGVIVPDKESASNLVCLGEIGLVNAAFLGLVAMLPGVDARPLIIIAACVGVLPLLMLIAGIQRGACVTEKYAVRIRSSSGETKILESMDRGRIQEIVNTIDEALVHLRLSREQSASL